MKNEWMITPSSAPLYIRRCSKCKKQMPYYCSEKFRINAQKKTVDVWLIYKCTKCENTCNIDIYSRVNPKSIDSEEYDCFQSNDSETAFKYAFNKEVINANKIVTDYSQIEYVMDGDILSLEEIQQQVEDLIEFEIKFTYNLDLDLSYIIRKNLNISLSQMEEMLSAGVISIYPPGPVRKEKAKPGQKVIVSREKLNKYLGKGEETIMENKLIEIIDEAVGSQLSKGLQELGVDANLFDNGLDSVGFINIIIGLENGYDIFIDQDDLGIEKFSTLKGIKEYVESRLAEEN